MIAFIQRLVTAGPASDLLSGFVVCGSSVPVSFFRSVLRNFTLDMAGCGEPADIPIINFCANKVSVIHISLQTHNLKVPTALVIFCL